MDIKTSMYGIVIIHWKGSRIIDGGQPAALAAISTCKQDEGTCTWCLGVETALALLAVDSY